MIWQRSSMVVVLVAATSCPQFARATIVLFQDRFTDGSVGTPVGINDPGTGATSNGSLSGSIVSTMGANDAYITANLGIDSENGTTYTFDTATAGQRGAFAVDFNLASVVVGGELSISFDDVNPILGGGGTSANWFAFSLSNSQGGLGGANVKVNDGNVPIGALVRDNGDIVTFGVSNTVAGATSGAGSHDLDLNLTNIVADTDGTDGSFSWEILVNGNSVTGLSGNVVGVDTTDLYLSLETTSSPSELGQLTITTAVPEPSAFLATGLVSCLVALRSRNKRMANSEEA